MDSQIQKTEPNYRRIYSDLLNWKFPNKKKICKILLSKEKLSALDVIEINRKIFGTADQEAEIFNQSCRSYDRSAILKILDYQKEHNLNNTQLARHFKLSRNTVTKWRKVFL